MVRKISVALFLIFTIILFCGVLNYIEKDFVKLLIFPIGTLCFICGLLLNNRCTTNHFLSFIFIYTIFAQISIIYNANMDIEELMWPFVYMSVGFMLLKNNIMSVFVYKILYYSQAVLMIYLYSKPGAILTALNGSNVHLLLYLILYIYSCQNNNTKVTFWPYLLFLIVVILNIKEAAGGRSGFIVGIFLLISHFIFSLDLYKIKNINYVQFFKFLLLAFVSCFVLYVILLYYYDFIYLAMENLQNRGLESTRTDIWEAYMQKISNNFFDFLFGAHIGGVSVLDEFSENLHNSYLMLHAKYGIVMLVIVITILFKTFCKLCNLQNKMFLVLFLSFIIRSNFDYTNFNSVLDVLFIVFCFNKSYFFREKSEVNGKITYN